MNNSERSQWIDNHEGLYNWWKATGLSKREFIKINRASIDETIRMTLAPRIRTEEHENTFRPFAVRDKTK